MQDLSSRDAILIDTPGKRPGRPEHRAFVETVLSNAKPDIVLLASAPRPLLKRAGKLSTVTASFGIIGC